MTLASARCECSRPKARNAEACPRCLEWDVRRKWTRGKVEGLKDRPQNFAGVRRALRNYLKEKGLEK